MNCNDYKDKIISYIENELDESNKKQSTNIAILGDLSFYHDMNGLIFTLANKLNMKFIILNNNIDIIVYMLNVPISSP